LVGAKTLYELTQAAEFIQGNMELEYKPSQRKEELATQN
jgi:hypothetical protein